ncbi:hypothetical protein MKX77_11230 [Bacillus sp. FSL R9-9410]
MKLNKNGKQQAEKCGLYLREKQWDITFYCLYQ